MTGLGLITRSLKLIGIGAEGETLSAETINDALDTLNDLLDSWSNENLVVFPVLREVFPLSSAGVQQTYTWGTGGDLDSVAPLRVKNALIQLTGSSPPIELPLEMMNQDEYARVILKTTTSNFPLYCYIDDAYPQKNVNVWPVPTDSTNSLVFYSQKPLTSAVLNTALSLPPGYLRPLRYNLAVDLAPEFRKEVSQEVAAIATESKATIKRTNTKPVLLRVDSALRAMPSVYNRKTDEYDR